MVHSGGMLHALPYTAEGLAQAAPIYDAQGTAFVGASRHVLLGINIATGHVQQEVSGDDSHGPTCSSLALQGGQGEGTDRSDLLWLKQRHSSVRAVETVFDTDSGVPRAVDVWNITVSAPQLGEVHGRLARDRHSGEADTHSLRALRQCLHGMHGEEVQTVSLMSSPGGSLIATGLHGDALWSAQLGSPVAMASRFDVCTLRGGRHLLLPAAVHTPPIEVDSVLDSLAQGGSFSVLSAAPLARRSGGGSEHGSAHQQPALFVGEHIVSQPGTHGMASLFALPMSSPEGGGGGALRGGAGGQQALGSGVALWRPTDSSNGVQSLTEHSMRSLVQGSCSAEGCAPPLPALPSGVGGRDVRALLRSVLGSYSPHKPEQPSTQDGSALVPFSEGGVRGIGSLPEGAFHIPLPPSNGGQGGQQALPKPSGSSSPPNSGDTGSPQVQVRVHSAAHGSNDSVSWSLVPLPPLGGLQPPQGGFTTVPHDTTMSAHSPRPVLLMDGEGGLLQAYLWVQGGVHGGSLQYLGGRVAGHVEVVWSPAFKGGSISSALQSLVLDDDEGGEGGGDSASQATGASSRALGMAGNVQLELLQQHLMSAYGSVVTLVAPSGIRLLLSLPWPMSALGRHQAREHVGGVLFPHAGTRLLPSEGTAASRDVGQQAPLATALFLMLAVAGGVMWVAFRERAPAAEGAVTSPVAPVDATLTPPAPLMAPAVVEPKSPLSTPATPLEIVKGGVTYRSVDPGQELLVSDQLLGKGSHGTRVYAGMLKSRPVAVKQMLRSFFDMASREVDLLIRSDGHPGIVRYYASRSAGDFVYLALERCVCTLGQAVQAAAKRRALLGHRYAALLAQSSAKNAKGGKGGKSTRQAPVYTNPFAEDLELHSDLEDAGGVIGPVLTASAVPVRSPGALPVPLPSDGTRAFLLSLASGVAHLHGACRIVHRDLKPGNILLATKGGKGGMHPKHTPDSASHFASSAPVGDAVWSAECQDWGNKWVPKISDMGLGKQLAGGSTAGSSLGGGAGPDASSDRLLGLQGGGASYSTEGGAGAPGTVGWQAPEILRALYGADAAEWAGSPVVAPPSWPGPDAVTSKKRPLQHMSPAGLVEMWNADSDSWLPVGPSPLLRGKAVAKPAKAAVVSLHNHIQRMLHVGDEGVEGGGTSMQDLLSAARTRAVDVWALGCVLYYVLDAGAHPYGGDLSRQARILAGKPALGRIAHIPEAHELLQGMLAAQPAARPRAALVAEHPFFWPDAQRCEFLKELSDRLDEEAPGSAALAAADALTVAVCGEGGWHRRLPKRLLQEFTERRAYDYNKLTHLLRVFRNQRNHYRDLSADALQEVLQGSLGTDVSETRKGGAGGVPDVPSALLRFFTAPTRFPRLLLAGHALTKWFFAHEPEFAAVLGKGTAEQWAPVSSRQYVRVQLPGEESSPPAAAAGGGACEGLPSSALHVGETAWLPSAMEFGAVVARAVQGAQEQRVWVMCDGAGGAGGVPMLGHRVRLDATGRPVQGEGGAVKPVTCAWPSRLGGMHTKFGGGANSAGGKYKCAICSDWTGNGGHCGRGVRCDFAHGPMEVTTRVPPWPSVGLGVEEWEASLQRALEKA